LALGIIDINDAGIQVAKENELLKTSPGFAVMDGKRLLVGEDALNNARLLPRWTNNRFWNQLNTDPIPNSTDEIRHHADLAFAHLESLWLPLKNEVDNVILLVPAFYGHPQLGLLLGMAKECGIPVAGVADSSLLVASEQSILPLSLHLDVHLHRITLTILSSGATLARKDVTTVTETGIFTLWDRWANIIADQFIQTSRFDPMHQAQSEQALFNQLPGWIERLNGSRANAFELNLGEINHTVSVSNDQLMAACIQIYPQIVQAIRSQIPPGETASLLLSHRFAGFPGLKDSLGLINNIELIELAGNQSLISAYTLADKIIPGNGAISHIISLPVSRQHENRRQSAPDTSRATHLLVGDHATAIGKSFQLSRDNSSGLKSGSSNPICTIFPRGNSLFMDIHIVDALLVNGEVADDTNPLKPGDVITIGDQTITLISVT
jgi:hypothetical protein